MYSETSYSSKTPPSNFYKTKEDVFIRNATPETLETAPLDERGLPEIDSVLNFLIGKDTPIDSEQFYQDLNRTSKISVDENVIWNKKKQNLSNHEKAVQRYLDFPMAEAIIHQYLKGLHQGAMASALEILNHYYSIDGKQYFYLVEDTLSTILISRKNSSDFTYEFSAPIHKVLDGNQILSLNAKKTLEKHNLEAGESPQTLNLAICQIRASVNIQLKKTANNQTVPEATFTLHIGSDLPSFQYRGNQWSPDLKRLENYNKHSLKLLYNFSAFTHLEKEVYSLLTQIDSETQTLLFKLAPLHPSANRLRGYMPFFDLKVKKEKDDSILSLLYSVLNLFNNGINAGLLKLKLKNVEKKIKERDYSRSFSTSSETEEKSEKIETFNSHLENLTTDVVELISKIIKKDVGYEELTDLAKSGLVEFFSHLGDQRIYQLFSILKSQPVVSLRNLGGKIHFSPDDFMEGLEEDEEGEFDKKLISLAKVAGNINYGIQTILSAIEEVCQKRQIEIIDFVHPGSELEVSDQKKVIAYIHNAIQGTLEDNPFENELKWLEDLKLKLLAQGKRRNSHVSAKEISESTSKIADVKNTRARHHRRSLSSSFSESLLQFSNQRNLTPTSNESSLSSPRSLLRPLELEEESKNESIISVESSSEPTLLLVHSYIPPFIRQLVCCPSQPPEKLAALWSRNPLLLGLSGGLGLHYACSQLLSVYPEEKREALPYLVGADLLGGLLGMRIGAQAIVYPQARMDLPARIGKALAQGLVMSVFVMGSTINLYLALHPDDQLISDARFWGELAPASLLLLTSYAVWHSIPRAETDRHLKLKTAIDRFFQFLYYGAIFEFVLMNVFNVPARSWAQVIPAVGALLMTAMEATSFHERAKGVMSYLSAINFGYLLIKDTLPHSNAYSVLGAPLTYTRLGFWLSSLVASSYFVAKNSVQFIQEYRGDPEIIIKKAEILDEEDSLYPSVSPIEYQALKEIAQSPNASLAEPDSARHEKKHQAIEWLRTLHANRSAAPDELGLNSPKAVRESQALR